MKQLRILLLGIAGLFSSLAASQSSRVQVIHNSADTALSSIDIYLGNTLVVDSLNFREATPYVNVPADSVIDLTIQPANSNDTINGLYRATINLDSTKDYLVVANGIISSSAYTPSKAFNLDVYPGAMDSVLFGGTSNVQFLVAHGATDAPIIDIYESSMPGGTIVDNIKYGEFDGYTSFQTSDYTVEIRDSANSKILAAYDAPFQSLNLGGVSVAVVASGFLDTAANSNGASFGLYVALPSGGALIPLPEAEIPKAKLQVIHNVADTAAAKVDVWKNDSILIDNFEFRTASPYVEVQAGVPFALTIAEASSNDTTAGLYQERQAFKKDSLYVLVANGIVSSSGYNPATAFSLDVFSNARDTAIGGSTDTDVLIVHGSTDAPDVNINETAVPAGQLVSNLSYGDFTSYLNLSTVNYVLAVENASNNNPIATYDAPLSTLGLGGKSITVLASGFADPSKNSNGAAFGLYVATPSGGALIPLSILTSLFENNALDQNMRLYPNPSEGQISIQYSGEEALPEKIELRDISGKVVRAITPTQTTVQHFDLSDLKSGIYFLRSIKGNEVSNKRLIIK